MPEFAHDTYKAYIAELRARARNSQTEANEKLNPLFKGKERDKGPEDFVGSSFLYMRSCDADNGSRPIACPAFWLSPDLRVEPASNLGSPTRELIAGHTYRLTATVRNRGDLMVPSAKVEFWLVTPSLGFDSRYAQKLGVATGRVMPYAATEVQLDYIVPPSLSGHRCLFARVFSFSPLDIPVDDYALNPVVDRHVAQLNLDIVAQGSSFNLQWIHHQNAIERFEIALMDPASQRAMRREIVTPLTLLAPRQLGGKIEELVSRVTLDVRLPRREGVKVSTERTGLGLELRSENPNAVPIDLQLSLRKDIESALIGFEKGVSPSGETRKLFAAYRTMAAQTIKTDLQITLPEIGLKPHQAIVLNLVRRNMGTNEVEGGVSLVVTGPNERP